MVCTLGFEALLRSAGRRSDSQRRLLFKQQATSVSYVDSFVFFVGTNQNFALIRIFI